MTMLAALGGEEFLLGFRLAGVRHTYNTEENPKDTVKEAMSIEDIGIVVIEENVLDLLPTKLREEVNDSVNPVFVPLSENAEESNLRAKIVRAIGVDLWDKGD